MAHVLSMTALQVRDPVEPFILMKSDDFPVQNASFRRLASFRETSKRFQDTRPGFRGAPRRSNGTPQRSGGVRQRFEGARRRCRSTRKGGRISKNSGDETRKGGRGAGQGANLEKNVLTLRRKVGGIAG
jgi:hypothetical protein